MKIDVCACGCGVKVTPGKKWRHGHHARSHKFRVTIQRHQREASLRRSPAVVKPSTKEIAWAAGFYEGEGSCDSSYRGKLRVVTYQCNPEMLRRMRRYFGGRVRRNSRKPTEKRRVLWVWEAGGIRAAGVLLTLYPFLSRWRRRQALRAIRGWTPWPILTK